MKTLSSFRKKLSLRLIIWSGLSIAGGGLLLIFSTGSLAQGAAIQALAWGGIDAVIALMGHLGSKKNDAPGEAGKQRAKLKRALWINTALDLVYIAAGIILVTVWGRNSPAVRGHGIGVIIQGSFLLLFDYFHANAVPPGPPEISLESFTGPEHLPFLLPAPETGKRKAVLLVHGFPGTPAEMRPLGDTLGEEGFTVRGILLPGFGADISTLFDRSRDQWYRHVRKEYEELANTHDETVLLGYSFGASLSLALTPEINPDRVVLISPFWRFGTALQNAVGRILSPFLPRYIRPFKLMDLDDPAVRHSLTAFFPHLDFTDPGASRNIRDLEIPLSLISEMLAVGREAWKMAPRVDSPVLYIQGSDDEVATESNSRKLYERLPPHISPEYAAISSGHDLIKPGDPGWDRVAAVVTGFLLHHRPGSSNPGDTL